MESIFHGEPFSGGPVLALDSGSPEVSVAVADGARVLASRTLLQANSSRELLAAVDQVLVESGLALRDLGGILALAGPGSFTGLRIGLATALGLHQATGLPATTLPTLEVLAATLPAFEGILVAAIDARRGEWVVQAYAGEPRRPLMPSRLGPPEEISPVLRADLGETLAGSVILVGFGASKIDFAEGPGREPPPLAAVAAVVPSQREIPWDAQLLTRPLYSRPPAVTLEAP